ncbi:MAG: aldose 1-epimerase family protein [Chitinophagaceae bacterium]|nr:MAG: aldose 1-epimerase family protein [Chitinophagaceae bacterium]
MPVIENDSLVVTLDPKGAELKRIYHKGTNLDYLWNADPAFWAKSSPILFPIVGTLKSDTVVYEGKDYHMGRHGFARDREFMIEKQDKSSIVFLLVSDEDTREKFPFEFEFRVEYRLSQSSLSVTYHVKNPDTKPLWFSVGGHPAFKVPLAQGEGYTDYYIEFEKPETAGRWLISKDGLIEDHSTPLLDNTNRLPLVHELFYKDAVVLKHLESASVTLRNSKSTHGLRFDYPGFPFLGIWAAKDADFVCIEPWCGIADRVNSNQQLTEKEGIEKLESGADFRRTWVATFF